MRKNFHQSAILLLIAVIPAICSGVFHPKRPSWKAQVEISFSAALSLKNVLWVDARSTKDYEEKHIPNAIVLNEDHWEEQFPTLLNHWNPGNTIIVYCSSQQCDSSKAIARRLKEAGLDSIFILQGGWDSWEQHSK